MVELIADPAGEAFVADTTTTDATGAYTFSNLIPGSYVVTASAKRLGDGETPTEAVAVEVVTTATLITLSGGGGGGGGGGPDCGANPFIPPCQL